MPDEDLEVDRVPAGGGGAAASGCELDGLSNILRTFNEHFGDIQWADAECVRQFIIGTIPERVPEDTAFGS